MEMDRRGSLDKDLMIAGLLEGEVGTGNDKALGLDLLVWDDTYDNAELKDEFGAVPIITLDEGLYVMLLESSPADVGITTTERREPKAEASQTDGAQPGLLAGGIDKAETWFVSTAERMESTDVSHDIQASCGRELQRGQYLDVHPTRWQDWQVELALGRGKIVPQGV